MKFAPQKPYVTPDFGKNSILSKLMIVGESHYNDPNDCPKEELEWLRSGTFNREMIERYAIPGKPGFFDRLWRTVTKEKCSRKEFWRSIAYINAMANIFRTHSAKVDGNDREDLPSQNNLVEALRRIKPTKILVLGKQNWSFFPSPTTKGLNRSIKNCPEPTFRLALGANAEVDDTAYWYKVNGGPWALAAGIYHPRFVKGFTATGTKAVITKLLRWSDSGPAQNCE